MPDNQEPERLAEDLCDQAVDAYADANYDEAIELYKKALELNPKYGDAYTGLAMCHQQRDDLDAAIAITRRYVEVAPDDILAFTNLSMFYQKKGMIAEAEAAGGEARRLDWKRQLKEAKDQKPGE
ncbi:MAG TPA: tetratricopeptide repeat protein [Candidatus Binataceae bacterium]|nr:tetratricopeptide repeat protein [Candidatus Binataceae bacterium]